MNTEAHENESLRKMLSVKEVASILGVHSGTIRRWEKEGLVPCHRIGPRGSLRFKQEDILDFLDNFKSEVGRTHE
jgi:excisionase family DNA binding protein